MGIANESEKTTWRSQVPATTTSRDASHLALPAQDFRVLLERLGPSLALWRAAEIAALRQEKYEKPVLDLGCGDGIVTGMVLPKIRWGCDPEPEALARAARRGTYDHLISQPIEHANLPEGCVSTVLSNSVLEHIPNLDRVLDTVFHILRPGGRLVLTTPSPAFSRWLTLPLATYGAWRNRQLQHLNLWTPDEWARKLGDRFKVLRVRPYLRRRLVLLWDLLELPQSISIARKPAFALFWKRLPAAWLDRLAQSASALDLGSPMPGGGQLIVASRV